MVDTTQVREGMEVVGSDGGHVGTVDRLDAGRIKLTRRDAADGRHHYLSLSAVSAVQDERLVTERPAAEALAALEGEAERSHTEA